MGKRCLCVIGELVEDLVQTGREITDAELHEIRRAVASAGFGPTDTMKATMDMAGLTWQGRVIASSDRLPNDERHYLRHAVAREEWPANTTLHDYIHSLSDAVLDLRGGICLDSLAATHWLTFFSRSGRWRGPASGGWILVGYNLDHGHWTTGFQPVEGLDYRPPYFERLERRWLRHPTWPIESI